MAARPRPGSGGHSEPVPGPWPGRAGNSVQGPVPALCCGGQARVDTSYGWTGWGPRSQWPPLGEPQAGSLWACGGRQTPRARPFWKPAGPALAWLQHPRVCSGRPGALPGMTQHRPLALKLLGRWEVGGGEQRLQPWAPAWAPSGPVRMLLLEAGGGGEAPSALPGGKGGSGVGHGAVRCEGYSRMAPDKVCVWGWAPLSQAQRLLLGPGLSVAVCPDRGGLGARFPEEAGRPWGGPAGAGPGAGSQRWE